MEYKDKMQLFIEFYTETQNIKQADEPDKSQLVVDLMSSGKFNRLTSGDKHILIESKIEKSILIDILLNN